MHNISVKHGGQYFGFRNLFRVYLEEILLRKNNVGLFVHLNWTKLIIRHHIVDSQSSPPAPGHGEHASELPPAGSMTWMQRLGSGI